MIDAYSSFAFTPIYWTSYGRSIRGNEEGNGIELRADVGDSRRRVKSSIPLIMLTRVQIPKFQRGQGRTNVVEQLYHFTNTFID